MFKLLLPILMVSSVYSASGSSLYSKNCKSCHGKKAEKKAMGKSKVIKGMSVALIEKDMHAYASGKRKAMGIVVKAKKDFVKKHSAADLRAVATYIHGL